MSEESAETGRQGLLPDHVLISKLPPEGGSFRLEPGREALSALAAELGLAGLRKLRFEGRLVPEGRHDWKLTARLGATVVQASAVTLEPVTTRIEEDVLRRYLRNWSEPEGDETEMDESADESEPLPATLDLTQVMAESLSLALPLYPRGEDEEFGAVVITEPGKDALSDEVMKPFAGLAALKGKLGDDGKA